MARVVSNCPGEQRTLRIRPMHGGAVRMLRRTAFRECLFGARASKPWFMNQR